MIAKPPILLLFLLLSVHHLFAQANLEQLVQAEKKFAAFSVSHSTKEAFQEFTDSNSIMFSEAKPVKATEFWNKRAIGPGVLDWTPVYAGIAASGDFGFTTGPWTYRSSKSDSISARGNFSTIWHINSQGEWKFLADLGSEDTPLQDTASYWQAWPPTDPTVYKRSLTSLLKTEKDFIRKTSGPTAMGWDRYEWYNRFRSTSTYCILNRNQHFPAVMTDQYMSAIHTMPEKVHYTISGSGIASSGDMGYVYGTIEHDGKQENYLRLWRGEKSGWKLVLEVLRY